MMERARAARAIISANRGSGAESLAFTGFMAIFHPDYDPDKVRDLARELQSRNRG
jgi:hypothetical protein